jgi:hypothetical protein
MMMAQGNLVIVDARKVFWRGWAVPGIESLRVVSIGEDVTVKLRLAHGADKALVADLTAAGIQVRVKR